MLIKPIQLVEEPLLFNEAIAPGVMEYVPDLKQVGLVGVEGQAELVVEHRGAHDHVDDIRVRAAYKGDFQMLCARCVDPVAMPVEGEFDLLFRPESADAESGERSITEDETEIGYYGGSGLLLEDVVREQVLLSLPTRTLCKPDCKGLCPRCGQNLNVAKCSCDEAAADPRWNALAGLADKLAQ